ncbi:unnamed protein product [Nesidiocoris tenuis]|uniref:Uncharacterized protein n=1 Tax=Nesidiocoris tenuis TaxID=355587 RepID=A0A6H5GXA9_9HEMI|nr:unnamed protein product [Nesidiocoris tenuis]
MPEGYLVRFLRFRYDVNFLFCCIILHQDAPAPGRYSISRCRRRKAHRSFSIGDSLRALLYTFERYRRPIVERCVINRDSCRKVDGPIQNKLRFVINESLHCQIIRVGIDDETNCQSGVEIPMFNQITNHDWCWHGFDPATNTNAPAGRGRHNPCGGSNHKLQVRHDSKALELLANALMRIAPLKSMFTNPKTLLRRPWSPRTGIHYIYPRNWPLLYLLTNKNHVLSIIKLLTMLDLPETRRYLFKSAKKERMGFGQVHDTKNLQFSTTLQD